MRNSLYDALEVNASSSTDAIRAALRTVVRRFWAVPRDASGDSEEAVRFAALAASILVDPVRRKDYDAALNPGVGAGPWRLPISGRDAGGDGGTHSRIFAEEGEGVSQLSIEATVPKALPGVDALADPLPDGKAWGSPVVWAALFAALVVLWFALARPLTRWIELSALEALLGTALTGVVIYALSAWMSRSQEAPGAAAGLSRLAIIKWRREGSIFIGTPPPQHDTAWIFKLRLMELTRSAAGFVTSASPWRRLTARLIDYALIAVVLYAVLLLLDQLLPVLADFSVVLRSFFVLPTLVVLLAIPAGALFQRVFGNTPGKWLLSLQLVTGITRPADHAEPTLRHLLWARATRAAWSGAALGFWPVALVRLPRHMKLARDTETDWESSGDSLVMARPLTAQALATGLVILLATILILLSGWSRDCVAIWSHVVSATASMRTAVNDAMPAPATLSGKAATQSTPSPQTQVPDGSVSPPSPAPAPVATTTNPAPAAPAIKSSSTNVPAATSAADAEMAKLASASQARRARIDGYAKQADTARRSGSYTGLQANCLRWTQEQPGNAEAWRCLGLAQFQAGAGREALPALRQALKLESNDAQVEAAILAILRP